MYLEITMHEEINGEEVEIKVCGEVDKELNSTEGLLEGIEIHEFKAIDSNGADVTDKVTTPEWQMEMALDEEWERRGGKVSDYTHLRYAGVSNG